MTWCERIVAARERGKFTQGDKVLARMWESCAVGEQRKNMPHVVLVFGGQFHPLAPHPLAPRDRELLRLGGDRGIGGFTWAVEHDEIDNAESLLEQIEDRVLELKRGQMSEKQGSFSDNSGDHVVS